MMAQYGRYHTRNPVTQPGWFFQGQDSRQENVNEQQKIRPDR